MKIEMKIKEISPNVPSNIKSQLSYSPLNMKRILKIIKRFGRSFHNGLYESLPEFAAKVFICICLRSLLDTHVESKRNEPRYSQCTNNAC